jgi:sugar phosphate permease
MFMQFYFGPLFYVPVEVLGQRVAGMSTGFSNMWANFGALFAAYLLGYIKDHSGSFTYGFLGTSAICVVGVVLAFVLAGIRKRALAANAVGKE